MNDRYERNISDAKFLDRVRHDAQVKIDAMINDCESSDLGDCYSPDGMKEIIVDWMDELGIYPDDLDKIMSELDF